MVKKIFDLSNSYFDKKVLYKKRIANVTVHLKYIDLKKITKLTREERLVAIDRHFEINYARLLKVNLFDSFQRIGSKKRPTGAHVSILLGNIEQLAKFGFVESVFINSVKGVIKIEKKDVPRFFCVKVIIAIQIEKEKSGMQDYEERYVLVLARTSAEAYRKIERQMIKSDVQYLNSQGQFVRWKFERLDDCHETDFIDPAINANLNGVEVFSLLKKRKLTKERYWDGPAGSLFKIISKV